MKMNPAAKELWLAALRSGEYQQGIGRLRSGDNKFCCLGVLSEIAVQQGVIAPARPVYLGGPDVVKGLDIARYYVYGQEGHFLPTAVQQWAQVSFSGNFGEHGSLADLNDYGRSFQEIADIIEENF